MRYIVIGGRISGLSIAQLLRKDNQEVIVLEAETRPDVYKRQWYVSMLSGSVSASNKTTAGRVRPVSAIESLSL